MKDGFLLSSETAKRLYFGTAKDLPIIDYHNHLSVADIANNRSFEGLSELWLMSDPYKHRLMRICGVPEHFITGEASPSEKLLRFFEIFPYLAGNPVFDWSRMELDFFFGIKELPCKKNAEYLIAKADEMLRSPEYSAKGLLCRFNIEYQSPVAEPCEELSCFEKSGVAPSLRADKLLSPDAELKARLEKESGIKITDTASYLKALCPMLNRFNSLGCRFADHSLDDGFFDEDNERVGLLIKLGNEYARRGWTLLLHLGAVRKTSSRLAKAAGAAGGYAAAGGPVNVKAICGLLDGMESLGKMPDTVLFPLNLSDTGAISVLQGSFSEDGICSKLQQGPAWWWCDHAYGINTTLRSIASFGALSQFIGMTTDSRSLLSFLRHDYFRRLLCSFLAEQNEKAEWDLPINYLEDITKKICYSNAVEKIKARGDKK